MSEPKPGHGIHLVITAIKIMMTDEDGILAVYQALCQAFYVD